MRPAIPFSLFILFSLELTAQVIGFNRIYPDAANCEPTRFEIIDEAYHVYCDCPSGENILITDLYGVQQSFLPNAFNDCVVNGSVNGATSIFRVDKNELLIASQPNNYSIELTRFLGNSCSDVQEQKSIYSFDSDQEIQSVDVSAARGSDGGIFIAAHEYLGETAGAFIC